VLPLRNLDYRVYERTTESGNSGRVRDSEAGLMMSFLGDPKAVMQTLAERKAVAARNLKLVAIGSVASFLLVALFGEDIPRHAKTSLSTQKLAITDSAGQPLPPLPTALSLSLPLPQPWKADRP
jgi:hypothetical protein